MSEKVKMRKCAWVGMWAKEGNFLHSLIMYQEQYNEIMKWFTTEGHVKTIEVKGWESDWNSHPNSCRATITFSRDSIGMIKKKYLPICRKFEQGNYFGDGEPRLPNTE